MLSCKDVTYLTSDYLDENMGGTLSWKIRLHLAACKCCRRFVKNLRITKEVAPRFVGKNLPNVDAEAVLKRIKERD